MRHSLCLLSVFHIVITLAACGCSSNDCIDNDGDSYGAGTSCLGEDCDDTDAAINPGESEIPYDGIDNDCNSATPDDDLDGDAYLEAIDCDDNNEDVNPGAVEDCLDGIDNDCDGDTDGNDDACEACSDYSDCDDEKSCTTDFCVFGYCQNQDSPDGTSCNDGLACTTGDTCADGLCFGTQIDCSTLDDECNVGVCVDVSAECIASPTNEGGACDDLDPYTEPDICQRGVCVGTYVGPSIQLSASSYQLLADWVSTADLVVEAFLNHKEPAGAGIVITLNTTKGTFSESGNNILETSTDNDGKSYATLVADMVPGSARVSASAVVEQIAVDSEIEVEITSLGSIRFVSAVPDRLGAGSNNASLITFELRDTDGNPMPAGVLVTFSRSFAPGVNLDPINARTDENGMVFAILNAGRQATTVTVSATVQVGYTTLQADSPPIAIVGAKPNARFITFACEQYNIGAFNINFEEIECTVTLADRYTNKIGFATNVIFKAEAGAITPGAVTVEYGFDMGKAVTIARTLGPFPADVSPIAGEPFIGSNNPRDGLVTVIAAMNGEEEFTDVNGNGTCDAGEPYVDIGEPFVDENDNDLREPTEMFIDTNNNDAYDGPNGVWDSDTLIWTQTWILWTGNVVVASDMSAACGQEPGNRYSVLCPAGFVIDNFASENFTWEVKDINLNPINMTLGVGLTVAGQGSQGASSPQLTFSAPDTLGGGPDGTGNTYWEDGGGFSGWVVIEGDQSNMPAADGSVSLDLDWMESTSAGASMSEVITSDGTFL
ncbi:MAG: hypothetical protein JRJ87_25190 [Deltaproteobacteria bacterium]|nr:hypothetical protein [Deltaproteobacteria bacterium]